MATHRPTSCQALLRVACAVLAVPFVAACATDSGPSGARSDQGLPIVVMISLDGTRPDDITRESIPSLVDLAARGAIAERLVPGTPANTFPSHVSLITGVEPEKHGVVGNAFRDSALGLFEKSSAHRWIEVEPLWSYLAARGIVSAAYHWPGSEGPWRGGRAARYRVPFDEPADESEKAEQILAWLDLPPDEGRPQLITSWFRGADGPGHRFGPGSPEVGMMLAMQNGAIAALIAGIDARGLFDTTTLIFVSDHGMASAARHVDLRGALEGAAIEAEVFGAGGMASVVLPTGSTGSNGDPALIDAVISVARPLGLEATGRANAPPEMRVDNPRFGDVIVRAPVGTAIVYADRSIAGFHGYDSAAPEMGGIFIAAGRGVSAGTRLPAVQAVDVVPTILELLGLEAAGWMEGVAIPGIEP